MKIPYHVKNSDLVNFIKNNLSDFKKRFIIKKSVEILGNPRKSQEIRGNHKRCDEIKRECSLL